MDSLVGILGGFGDVLTPVNLLYVLIGALIGNLREPAQLVLATGALGTHFYVNDRALAREHASSSGPAGRYLLALAVLVGWATADIQSAHPRAHAVVQALLAGGIVLNSLNEELPEGNDGRFGPFAAGIVSYTALMLLFLRALRS